MTRATNARIAGFTFLAYIAAGITSLILFRRAAGSEGVAEKLAGLAAHASDAGILVILGLVQCFSALVLGVTLYAITRDEDPDLAILGLVCRVGEGVTRRPLHPGHAHAVLARHAHAERTRRISPAAHALAQYLLRDDAALTATFFAVGSTAFTYLLLRGRMIPAPLAVLGFVASAPAGDRLALAARGVAGRPAGVLHVAADAGVRGAARAVAPDQRRGSLIFIRAGAPPWDVCRISGPPCRNLGLASPGV